MYIFLPIIVFNEYEKWPRFYKILYIFKKKISSNRSKWLQSSLRNNESASIFLLGDVYVLTDHSTNTKNGQDSIKFSTFLKRKFVRIDRNRLQSSSRNGVKCIDPRIDISIRRCINVLVAFRILLPLSPPDTLPPSSIDVSRLGFRFGCRARTNGWSRDESLQVATGENSSAGPFTSSLARREKRILSTN